MKEYIRIDFERETIILGKAFAKKAQYTYTDEYTKLMAIRDQYPDYKIVRRQIKKNTSQEHYRGLTYDYMRHYMRHYINAHEPTATRDAVLNEFNNCLDIAKCHSRCHRYPTIKTWFLNKYPEIKEFGIQEIVEEPTAESSLALFSANSVDECA